MNGPEMIVAIVAICSIAGVIRGRFGMRGGSNCRNDRNDRHARDDRYGYADQPQSDPEADRMRGEIRALKERIAVLERIATDRSQDLEREIEALRDRR